MASCRQDTTPAPELGIPNARIVSNKVWGTVNSGFSKALAWAGCLFAGCHVQGNQIVGPTYQEAATGLVTGVMPVGTVIEGEFQTAKGAYSSIVEGALEGKKFITSEIAICPKGGGQLVPGVREMKALAQELIAQAKAAGYDELEINAVRYYNDGTKRVVQWYYDLRNR